MELKYDEIGGRLDCFLWKVSCGFWFLAVETPLASLSLDVNHYRVLTARVRTTLEMTAWLRTTLVC